MKQAEKRLCRLQRHISRKYEMNKEGSRFVKTSNMIKLEKKIPLLHRRLTNVRDHPIHQVTIAIVKIKPGRVVMEMWNIKGMMKDKHVSKAIAQ